MNETLQQFCQRILPVVQAGAEGKEIEEKCSIGNSIWEGKIARLFLPDYEYRIAQPKATPLPITPEMWAMIDPKYKFSYLNHIGDVWFSVEELKWNGGAWDLKGLISNHCESPLAIDTSGIVPKLSLTERPKSADEALKQEMANESRAIKKVIIDGGKATNHDDCQLLVVSSCGAKSPFQTALDEMCCCGVPDRLFKFLSNIPSK